MHDAREPARKLPKSLAATAVQPAPQPPKVPQPLARDGMARTVLVEDVAPEDWEPPETPSFTMREPASRPRDPGETVVVGRDGSGGATGLTAPPISPNAPVLSGERRLVRIIDCDKAVNRVYFSREVCERFVELAREMIRTRGHAPVEFEREGPQGLTEGKVCGRMLSVAIVDDLLMGEVAPEQPHANELLDIIDSERYRVLPKYLGQFEQRGLLEYVKPYYLNLLGFVVYRLN